MSSAFSVSAEAFLSFVLAGSASAGPETLGDVLAKLLVFVAEGERSGPLISRVASG